MDSRLGGGSSDVAPLASSVTVMTVRRKKRGRRRYRPRAHRVERRVFFMVLMLIAMAGAAGMLATGG